jgi:plastocyanin
MRLRPATRENGPSPRPAGSSAHAVRRGFGVLALLVAGAMIAAGCGGSSDNGGSSGATTASPDTSAPGATSGDNSSSGGEAAKIEGFAFHPDTIKVSAGQKITWTNDDSTAHTVTADDGSFDSGSVADGKSFSFTFAKAGTFKYHCSIHSSMLGTVDVT